MYTEALDRHIGQLASECRTCDIEGIARECIRVALTPKIERGDYDRRISNVLHAMGQEPFSDRSLLPHRLVYAIGIEKYLDL